MSKNNPSKPKLGLGIFFLVVLIAAFYCYHSLNSIVQTAILRFTPAITGTSVSLSKVSILPLTGKASISGFELGNPKGYPQGAAFKLAKGSLSLNVKSLFGSKVIIRKIEVASPEIFLMGSMDNNNLIQIQKNVQSNTSASNSKSKASPKKLQIDDFLLSDAKVHVNFGIFKDVTLNLPDIHLTNLGKSPEGITANEFANEVVGRISIDVGRLLLANLKAPTQILDKVRGSVQKVIENPLKNLPLINLFK